VKWLTDIELADQPFTGHYQRDKYCYEWRRGDRAAREPVTLQRVRSLITEPTPSATLARGDLTIRGVAWSGAASIARVEIAIGNNWQEAELIGERTPHCWQRWELLTRIDNPGPLTLRARAADLAGHIQPDCAEWNVLGYGNNSVQHVPILIV
jgi:DMSO/TMAO reductase YedYZ molybdopterin-dependent catalytic subunit